MANQEREQMLEQAWRAREEGKRAYFAGYHGANPHNGLNGFCWNAGFKQDIRNVEQLVSAFEKGHC